MLVTISHFNFNKLKLKVPHLHPNYYEVIVNEILFFFVKCKYIYYKLIKYLLE